MYTHTHELRNVSEMSFTQEASQTHAPTHTHTHTHTHTNKHIHTHTYTHTRTQRYLRDVMHSGAFTTCP